MVTRTGQRQRLSATAAASPAPGLPPLLAVGTCVSPGARQVSGQAMMFQLLVDVLAERGARVRVFDIAEQGASRRGDGRASWARVVEYLLLLPRLWWTLLWSRRRVVYLTTAQSLVGFLRDAAVIWPAWLRGHTVVAHQFGGNYGSFYARRGPLARCCIRRTMRRAAAIIVEGPALREHYAFLPDWRTRVHAVPNGMPERSLQPATRPKTYMRGEPFRLLYLSNMLETKGYPDVLEAVRLLRNERGLDVRCRFAGRWLSASDSVRFPDPDDGRRAFGEFVTRHGLADAVTHDDGLFGEAKAAAFRQCHVFLLPSNYVNEGQPVSVLEAMAHAAPVIGTRHRLIPSMVAHGQTGWLVDYGRPEQIADRIAGLIRDPEQYEQMSAASVQRFRERFTAESFVERVRQVLAGVAKVT